MRGRIGVVIVLMIANCDWALCACRTSYCKNCLRCDYVADLGDVFRFGPYQDNYEWVELYVGSPDTIGNKNKEVLDNVQLTALRYFRRIVVENQLKDFTTRGTYGLSVSYLATTKTLIFSGNKIERLMDGLFPNYDLDYFSLRNNSIKLIDKGAFWMTGALVLDLSENQIAEINHPFEYPGTIEELYLDNNALFYIEAGSFPPTLRTLRLDHNVLNHMDEGILGNLPNLRDLSLSHNAFTHSFDVVYLKALEKFDLSHNQVISIKEEHFRQLEKLKYVNLENNKIKKFSFAPFLNKKVDHFLLLLANNQLSFVDVPQLNASSATRYTLTLYGNPWACICLTIMETELAKLSHVAVRECKTIESGSQPLCFKKNLPATRGEAPLSSDTYQYHTDSCKEQPVVLEKDLIDFNKVAQKIHCSDHLYEEIFLSHIYLRGAVA